MGRRQKTFTEIFKICLKCLVRPCSLRVAQGAGGITVPEGV